MPEIKYDGNKMSHGVTTLTYVGDDTGDASLVPSSPRRTIGLLGLAAVVFGGGVTRVAGAAAIAYWAVGQRTR